MDRKSFGVQKTPLAYQHAPCGMLSGSNFHVSNLKFSCLRLQSRCADQSCILHLIGPGWQRGGFGSKNERQLLTFTAGTPVTPQSQVVAASTRHRVPQPEKRDIGRTPEGERWGPLLRMRRRLAGRCDELPFERASADAFLFNERRVNPLIRRSTIAAGASGFPRSLSSTRYCGRCRNRHGSIDCASR
jgi:hypothetical protein